MCESRAIGVAFCVVVRIFYVRQSRTHSLRLGATNMQINSVSDFRRAVRCGPYAWPGGYDHYAITSDGGTLCHACMSSERRAIVDSIATKCDDGWRVVALDATCNTDGEVRCDHCNTVLQNDWTEVA